MTYFQSKKGMHFALIMYIIKFKKKAISNVLKSCYFILVRLREKMNVLI